MTLTRKLASEFIGTLGLVAIVVGSGIMAERLSAGNDAVALLGNSIATGAGLFVLIYGFSNISNAHFNPAVTIADMIRRRLAPSTGAAYISAQISGGICGTMIANLMFTLPIVNMSSKLRAGGGQFLGEFVATFGLIAVIRLGVRFHPNLVGALVALYITAAYWFTSSTSFANPAVTIARTLSNTFAGIAPESVPPFIVAQLLGMVSSLLFTEWIFADGDQTND
ncbi:aquaporin [Leptolyngbya sp. 7M]|uniref:aquaporin n=1 Tax=Leptolyngbya sp. 7M TaxID=2812896 RepID=UPI001B8C7AB2|nr:MIP/aquaporin family protein [Leptolyngbya sp. 7M]QYO65559.1 aquaporin family protein [Leptolyngbya sp. 7M]